MLFIVPHSQAQVISDDIILLSETGEEIADYEISPLLVLEFNQQIQKLGIAKDRKLVLRLRKLSAYQVIVNLLDRVNQEVLGSFRFHPDRFGFKWPEDQRG